VEQRLDQLEKRNKRLTVALTMTVVAMCAVVTMAATGLKDGHFDKVVARHIFVTNEAGQIIVALGASDDGNGLIQTLSAKGKMLVALNSTVEGKGTVTTYHPNGKKLVDLGSTVDGNGTVKTYQPNGKTLVRLTATDNGGMVAVVNKTGEGIVSMGADDYGNGVVWAGNRKGDGSGGYNGGYGVEGRRIRYGDGADDLGD